MDHTFVTVGALAGALQGLATEKITGKFTLFSDHNGSLQRRQPGARASYLLRVNGQAKWWRAKGKNHAYGKHICMD